MNITDRHPTLLEFAGAQVSAPKLSESILVIVDAQKEFSEGKLRLAGFDLAIAEGERLLARARASGVPIIHVNHRNRSGAALFDPALKFVEPVDALKPIGGETIVIKGFANAFFQSTLAAELTKTGRTRLLVFGYRCPRIPVTYVPGTHNRRSTACYAKLAA